MKEFIEKFKALHILDQWIVIKGILILPAGIWHELSHILAGIITLSKLQKINKDFFIIEEERIITFNIGLKYEVKGTNITCNLKIIFIAIAPVLTLPILLHISPWTLLYILFASEGFFLSNQDIQTLKTAINNLKGK